MVNSKVGVFLFIGRDNYLKEKAIGDLSASILDNASKDLDRKVFHGQDAECKDIIDYITTIPFFSSKRLAVIKNFERLPKECRARLINYIKKPVPSTYLVLETDDDVILKEHDDIARHINVRYFNAPKGAELASWMKAFIQASGKRIDEDALTAISQVQGRDLLSLKQELEKLIAFVGERGEIGARDVEEIVGKGLIASAFDLAEAVEKKDIDEALKVCSELLKAGKRHHEIVGLLCWHLKRTFKAKSLQLEGAGNSEIAEILRIGRRYADGFFRQLKDVDITKIKQRMSILLEADLDMKRSKYGPALVLEFALIRLCLG